MKGARHLHWSWLCLLVLLAGCAGSPGDLDAERHARAGLAIQAVYEQALPTLPAAKQRHYAQRLYRLTGDDRYLPPNRAYGERLLDWLERDLAALEEPGHAAQRSRELVEAYSQRTAKQRARREMFAEWEEMIFARQLLFRLIQAEYHGLLPALEERERGLAYLASVDWLAFFTDPDVLRIYAAQVANQAHFLHQLGVIDLREEVVAAFRARYPPGIAASLARDETHNWLYGLTHFVIAASRYYQQPVSAEEFTWVLATFEDEEERILGLATEDILAEVALSFLLAGREDHPLVLRIRDALVAAVDPEAGIIPSPQGSLDLAGGEHRNVLAIMVLRWPDTLHPGPNLSDRLL
ncbi:DUF3541 domain-containing protein [Halomonas sp. BM-2019]|uniref:DUF3541 domain-containing protein n=1 Tax=Halomonas sp. BM-2019 TaxID=2811227 RepID=UPI001B3C4263|nr:MAG: DUF3541 domain-containing protein [Halomonas sp. BM-2019]